jgi:uroporphyrinogen III methyltransferase/synthase
VTGKVYIVGAGPGDPGLITVRGRQCIRRAEVLVYDDLVHPELVAMAAQAEAIYVGKRTNQHSLTQEDINDLLVDQAQRHSLVVRLKGGDPFVFGRGGEEALALTEARVPFEVVPGVTSGVAAPAYAGIPVTHRGLTSSVSMITGHGLDPESVCPLDLSRIALEGTLCFYMAVRTLPHVARQLMDLGRKPETPVAVIGSGTYPNQQTVRGTLEMIAERAQEEDVRAPAIVVVGEVVDLRERIAWLEARPLHRVRVAVTHMQRPEGELEQRLREAGADVFRFPTLEIAPAQPDPALDRIPEFDWVFLTSNNAAELVLQRIYETGGDVRDLADVRIATVGGKTSTALAQYRIRPDVAVEAYQPEAVAEALRRAGMGVAEQVLFPRPDLARRDLAEVLRELGVAVTEVITHRREVPSDVTSRTKNLLAFKPDWVLFTNAAAVRNFAQLTTAEQRARLLEDCRVASIGPSTSAALEEAEIALALEPTEHTVAGLVAGLAEGQP